MNIRSIRGAFGVATLAAAAAGAGSARATVTVFTTAATFAAATTAPFTDSFSDLSIDALGNPLTRLNGPYGYSVGANGGLFGAGTVANPALSTSLSGALMTIGSFTGGVRGAGGLFYGTDVSGAYLAGQSFTLTATDSLGASLSFTLTAATQASFVGFVSDAFLVSLTLTPADLGAWGTVDNLVLSSAPGAPVPEPATWALLGAGLLALRRLRGAGG